MKSETREKIRPMEMRSQVFGSALTEFVVLMLVLVPMMMGIPMIGKLVDLRQTAVSASRYAAWESTVASNYTVASQVETRFFRDPSSVIATNKPLVGKNRLWGESAARESEILSQSGAVHIEDSSANVVALEVNIGSPGSGLIGKQALKIGDAVSKSGDLLGWAEDTEWGLPGDGLIRAAVQVNVKNNDFLQGMLSRCGSSAGIYACIRESNSIMVDGWSSGSDTQAANRTRSYVPAVALKPVGDLLSKLGYIPPFKELRDLDDAFGRVDITVLPLRLENYERMR